MIMKQRKIYLQLFADAGSASGDGTATTGVSGESPVSQQGEDLSKVIYGKSDQNLANSMDEESSAEENFENLIKKGGKYHDDFNKQSQKIINKRFAESKKMEEQLKSHQEVFDLLANKYGVDASDTSAVLAALNADDSLFEQAAYEQGLSVENYKKMRELENQNRAFKEAKETQEREKRSQEIYSEWLNQADQMVSKYGIQNFDLQTELLNENFTNMLSNGIDIESAYKAIHFDEMVNGAMAATAKNVETAVSNRVASRNARPMESAVSSSANSSIFKSDVSKFSYADMDECIRRAAAGDRVVL